MSRKTTIGMLAFGAVAAAAALEGWQQLRQGEPMVAHPVARSATAPALAGDGALPFASQLKRERLSGEVIGDPFGAREAPKTAVAPPPAPVAAPFPYRYAGQLSLEDGGRRVYLMKGNELVLINVGDVLDGVFKVTSIAEDALEVLHVPSAIATQMLFSAMVADTALPGATSQPAARASISAPATSAIGGSVASASSGSGASYAAAPFMGAGVVGAPLGMPSAAASAQSPAAGAAAVTAGSMPTGQLGSPGPSAGAAPLGVAPSSSGSMPMLAAPVGVMRTLPPPTGRLGI